MDAHWFSLLGESLLTWRYLDGIFALALDLGVGSIIEHTALDR
jgi:hypothetical protein